MKRKLLLAVVTLFAAVFMGGSSLKAQQTDVTSLYLTNADFSAGTPVDNNVCTYGKDMTVNNTTYYGAQVITGWENASVGETDSGFENSKLAGALFEYGSTPWLAGSGTPAPATGPTGNAGNAAGLCAVWNGKVQYTQDVTLPAGSYTVRFQVYNATAGIGNSSGVITTDLFGFIAGSTAYYAPNNTFAIGQWSNVVVTFNLTEETAGKISMGYAGPSGNAAMPHLFVDNVKILRNVMAKDFTSKVNSTGWTGAGDGYQGGAINTARQYGDKTIGRHIYQTVSGLDNGTYEVALYAISQKEWQGSLANDAGDVAYVFADNGTHELKEWINARARAGYPGDENVGIYTISDVQVTNGTLTLGMGLAQADLTEWHHVQIKSLVRTYIDLSDLITAYNNALASAKAIDQTKKMAASIKTALNSAIDAYDEGKVNLEDGDAIQAATDALLEVIANANTSISSYAIIDSGSIPNNSIEGWTNTGTGSLEVNTWSTESGPVGNNTRASYDGTGMTVPFIQSWIWKGNNGEVYLGNGTVSYTLAGLEPGEVYYAQALVRAYSEGGNVPNGPNFFINNVVTDMTTNGTPFEFSGMKGYYGTLGGAATVGDDGKIVLGVTINDANYNWVAFKNVSIQSMDDAFDAAVAKVEALEGIIPAGIYNTAYAVVTANSGSNYPTTAEGFEQAIAKIEAAATAASASVSSYNAFKAMKTQAETLQAVDNDNATANGTLATAINDKNNAVEAATTIDAIDAATADLKAAMTTYVSAANPVGDAARFDCTFMLTNPDLSVFKSNGPQAGWFTDQNFSQQNSQVMQNNNAVANSTDNTKFAMYEYWSGSSCAIDGYTVYTKITLPQGTYRMDALCMTGWGYAASQPDGARNITFSAGDVDGTPIITSTLEPATLDFVQAAEAEVKIGLKAHDGNTCNWMGIGYVQLFKVPAKTFVIDEAESYDNTQGGAGLVTLNRTIKTGLNSVVLPFNMTQTEVKEYFGEDAVVYVVNSFDDETSTVLFEEVDGIQANVPCILKATTAGTSYEIDGRTLIAGKPVVTFGNLQFIGSYEASTTIASKEGNFILYDGELLAVDSDKPEDVVTLKGTRAYFKVVDGSAAGSRVLSMNFDGGEADDIVEVEGEKVADGIIYNLAGQPVGPDYKGVAIINGKTVLLK